MLSKYKNYLLGRGGTGLNTAKIYLSKLQHYQAWLGYCLTKATPGELDKYIVYLKQKKTKISRNTIKLTITALRSFYKWYSFEFNTINIAENLKPAKEHHHTHNILKIDDVKAMIVAAGTSNFDELRNAAIIIMLADTGIRVSELINIKVGHIQVNKQQLILKVQGIKTYHDRQIPFCFLQKGGLIAEVFMAYYKTIVFYLKKGSEEYFFQHSLFYQKKIQKASKQLTRNSINYLVKKLAKQAEILIDVHPHSFRHFYATYLLVNGENIQTVQARLGHKDIGKTIFYLHSADIVKTESAKTTPLAGIKTKLTGFV